MIDNSMRLPSSNRSTPAILIACSRYPSTPSCVVIASGVDFSAIFRLVLTDGGLCNAVLSPFASGCRRRPSMSVSCDSKCIRPNQQHRRCARRAGSLAMHFVSTGVTWYCATVSRSSTFSHSPRSRKYFNSCSRAVSTSCHSNSLPVSQDRMLFHDCILRGLL